jgi:hypothetical protein
VSERQVVDELHRRVMNTNDGYAARESLAHPLFTTLDTDQQHIRESVARP